ncbi:hypothetical protein [Mucisphaera calidilacus]|uniref:PEP-CTERM protein-sorting domain-containing protein n=1 Tax=Mucisphaera calidilacus TaxID=2527982 RepID=A0A518BVL4_9BACT|nr:hypothetical protein [Mucisphaera calidilacus]QDU71022.1 hypothetical protein Pan265_08670 [Mucisphaera calidilacus]
MKHALLIVSMASMGFAGSVSADELLRNPGFGDPSIGAEWGSFGAAGFHDFFGGNAHASLFSDNPGNFGGVFQTGITGDAGVTYSFELLDVRLEENIDTDLRFGLEFFEGDDATRISDIIVPVDLSVTGDGLSFDMTATAPAGTVFIRPIIQFDNVRSTAGGQENAFVFEASLTVVPAPSTLGLGLAGLSLLARRRA